MRACEKCFLALSWIGNAGSQAWSLGECDFGHVSAHRTWDTTVWRDHFLRLFDLYELDESGAGDPLHVQVQDDWRIFALGPSDVHAFLLSAVSWHGLLDEMVSVRLKGSGSDGDHLTTWTQFSQEIRTVNRYFPSAVPDLTVIGEAFVARAERVASGTTLHRARIVDGVRLPPAAEMGKPPIERAGPGRANPIGIAYLYLSLNEETCLQEVRAANHSLVASAQFHTLQDLTVLNLADIDAPDFFDNDEVARVYLHRYITALSRELSRPVRSSDSPIEYIPTQYLTEFAKSLGLDGVLYSSSLHAGGRNLVLFDDRTVRCDEIVRYLRVTSIKAEYEALDFSVRDSRS
jgi:RES domain-containing protein